MLLVTCMIGKKFIRRWPQTQAAAKILAEHLRRSNGSKSIFQTLSGIFGTCYKTTCTSAPGYLHDRQKFYSPLVADTGGGENNNQKPPLTVF